MPPIGVYFIDLASAWFFPMTLIFPGIARAAGLQAVDFIPVKTEFHQEGLGMLGRLRCTSGGNRGMVELDIDLAGLARL
jgi:hypothetical protein